MFFPKFMEGNIDDSFNPMLTIDNKYPGTIKINAKNAIIPKINTYLLSDTIPIGMSAIRINRKKRIGNFLRFLKGYFREFDIILPTFIKPPRQNYFSRCPFFVTCSNSRLHPYSDTT
ncbi:MAG: hypothetical protein ACSW71_04300 [Methanobrevibacter sp.]